MSDTPNTGDIVNKLRDPARMKTWWDQYGLDAANDIEKLRRDLAAARAELDAANGRVADAIGECARWMRISNEQQAELEQAKRDAERYRFLRKQKDLTLRTDNSRWRMPDGTTFVSSHYLSIGSKQYAPMESLDEGIDIAMKQGK